MLKCALDENNRLNIKFDIPIPVSCFGNTELTSFTKTIGNQDKGSLEFEKNNCLSGIKLSIANINNIVDNLLSETDAKSQKEIFKRLFTTKTSKYKKGLEVNFHQNPFDTPERYWNFILAQGHFASYFFNRINWFMGPSNEYVTDFPLHVDLESASTCNMNCPMCYRNELKHTGQMEFDLFKKAVDECAGHNVFSIRLSWRGETLTHPRIKEMITYATSRIKNVSFLTNAFYLNDEMIDCFIESGVSYVAVSFDGIKEIYEKIRYPAKFEENYGKLLLLKQKKKEANSLLPQVRLCTIWPAIKDNPDEYYNTMESVSDYMVCNPYINFKGPMEIKHDFICQYPWERIVIGYNGDAQCCTGWNADDIILGNVTEKSIYDMWHSPPMERIREIHSQGARMQLNSCAQCRHGSTGDPNINIDNILERNY